MINFEEIFARFEEPGWIPKLRGVGDLLQYAVPLAALLTVAFVGGDGLAMIWVKSVFATAIIVQLMKRVFNNTKLGPRPDGHSHSFPSGHTSGAFSGAWFFLLAWGWPAAVVPLIAAVTVAVSRIVAKKHWPRDTVVGALVALVVSAYFFGMF